jgi:hypothetical protein
MRSRCCFAVNMRKASCMSFLYSIEHCSTIRRPFEVSSTIRIRRSFLSSFRTTSHLDSRRSMAVVIDPVVRSVSDPSTLTGWGPLTRSTSSTRKSESQSPIFFLLASDFRRRDRYALQIAANNWCPSCSAGRCSVFAMRKIVCQRPSGTATQTILHLQGKGIEPSTLNT